MKIKQVDNEIYPICRCDECGKELTDLEIKNIENNKTKGFQMCEKCLSNYNISNSELEESKSENIIKKCIGLMNGEQLVELYETFNGGTFDNKSFKEWIGEYI